MPNKKTVVGTNSTPGSIKEVQLRAITFQELWDNYPSGNPYNDPTGEYENQCAIRMSVTFHRIGSEMKSFSQKVIKPMPGKKDLGRLILDGKPTAARAYELAEWLKLRPFAGLPPPENVAGPDWQSKVHGRTGIIYFFGYWRQEGDSADQLSGGHIDLWNRDTLTPSAESYLRFRVGISQIPNPLSWLRGRSDNVYSDLGKSKQILFWEIR
ncbi:type VI secretion system amidase effector protein Tae4 [Paraburkholderia sp. BL10I2N1]|uniref:type VI secretion system amidase effector protein Tae4 n=1 Tax=Paraburkholderia sp. BL10I2N1 TaxID=1938796 RepID=UPI00105F8F23|nr:type VI secretion system amidase effector protein Tae4 [Paraburkholderia sp. BL10I2N1]TDN61201.1 type VI secretion system (T6SS) effector Tae4 (amidase) [Paraburkholderia sp. BL10I2N1]